ILPPSRDEFLRRCNRTRDVEEAAWRATGASRDAFSPRGSGDERGQSPRILSEAEGSANQKQLAHSFRYRRRKDGRERPAERVADEDGLTSVLAGNLVNGCPDPRSCVLGQPPLGANLSSVPPGQQVYGEAGFKKSAHDTHLRNEIEDVGPLDWGRNDE